jgi:hypothetical protein
MIAVSHCCTGAMEVLCVLQEKAALSMDPLDTTARWVLVT